MRCSSSWRAEPLSVPSFMGAPLLSSGCDSNPRQRPCHEAATVNHGTRHTRRRPPGPGPAFRRWRNDGLTDCSAGRGTRTTINDLLAAARARLERLEPAAALDAVARGASL